MVSKSLETLIIAWVRLVAQHRIGVIIATVALTLCAGFYIKNNLSMSADTTDMLSAELPWRKLDIQYESSFPQFLNNVLIVIEAKTADEASDAAATLYAALQSQQEFITELYYPKEQPYFYQSALLFLDTDELQDLADNLAKIQPFLGTLLTDKNLRGLFNMLSAALKAKKEGEVIELTPFLAEINRVFKDDKHALSWQRLMTNTSAEKTSYREFIILKAMAADDVLPNEKAINHIRAIIDSTQLTNTENINIKLTGGAVLAYEELKSVSEFNIKAIIISLVLVAIILILGLGSLYLVFACLATLIIGLIATTAFATATVGQLNLISVAFAVLYIGLGIDFAIHMALRYREQQLLQADNPITAAVTKIFRSLLLCAVTTAIGFYSFMPTSYKGVAELGWIAGSGILISLLLTFTLLPALLSFTAFKLPKKSGFGRSSLVYLANVPYRYTKLILVVTLIMIAIIIFRIGHISFDTNMLNLQNPDHESVKTYRELLADSDTSPWTGILLKQQQATVLQTKQDLEQLPLVDKVIWLGDLLPDNQAEKLAIIDEINLLLGGLETTSAAPNINHAERVASIKRLYYQVDNMLKDIDDAALAHELNLLQAQLNVLLADDANLAQVMNIESRLLKNIDGRIIALNKALTAQAVSFDDIPSEIYQRWFSNGYYKMQILPSENLNNNAAMRRFVAELQAYDKAVIGVPVISIEAGNAVIRAFQTAFMYTFIAITLLLFIVVNKRDALMILATVLVGAIFTFGLLTFFNIPLNFANIIGLPLLFGLGVDSGIHIVYRFRQAQQTNANILLTSASRGVIVSALTTIFSIGNLAFSTHQGTASMGLLLTVGLMAIMVTNIIVLPALLVWQQAFTRQ